MAPNPSAIDRLRNSRVVQAVLVYRLWIADAYAETGQLGQAVPYYRSLWLNRFKAYGAYRLAGIYETLGRDEEARAEYSRFLRMWKRADDDLPQLRKAQEALERLGG